MDNLTWYSGVMQFCRASDSCGRCPYHLLANTEIRNEQQRPCFASKENLENLTRWLAQRPFEDDDIQELADRIADEDDDEYLLKDFPKD